MKYLSSMNALIGVVIAAVTSGVDGQDTTIPSTNPNGCVIASSIDAAIDFFPFKVEATVSEYWDIQYYRTYKVLTNKAENTTYLLYQCGIPLNSTMDTSMYNATIEIPVTKVSVSETNTISFLEQLNMIDSIVSYTSDVSYIGSSCLLEKIANNEVLQVRNSSEFEELSSSTDESVVLKLQEVLAFGTSFDREYPFGSTMTVFPSTQNELTNEAIFEWIKFYSAFFNLEDMANQAFDATQDRSECITLGASVTVSDKTKPTVLWAYYSEYCGGWDVGKCPNYYCQFAEACFSDIVVTEDGKGSIISADCDATYFNTTELLELGQNAEYWIFPADNWNKTYTTFKDELDTMVSVQKKQVFDVQGSGMNAWFEQRYAEYYDVQQDFCSIVGTTTSLRTRRGWFRNTLTDESIDDRTGNGCLDVNATAILPYDFICEFNETSTTTPDVDDGSSNNATSDDGSSNNATSDDDKNATSDDDKNATANDDKNSTGSKSAAFVANASIFSSAVMVVATVLMSFLG